VGRWRRSRRRSPDAAGLPDPAAVPFPCRVADWPEVRLDAVVPDPEQAEHVLLVARCPAHPEVRALLVVEVDHPANFAHRLLMHWRDVGAALSQTFLDGGVLLLGVRGSDDVLSARVVREVECARNDSR